MARFLSFILVVSALFFSVRAQADQPFEPEPNDPPKRTGGSGTR